MLIGTAVLIGIFTPTTIHGDLPVAWQPLNPFDVLSETPTPDELKEATKYLAEKYGLDADKLIRTLQCESGFRYNAKNPNSTASGVCQFIDSTWKLYCKGDKSSAKDQLRCLSEFWLEDEQHHWECYNMLYGY